MSQISPPIRILLVAVIGLCAAYFLFLKPKDETVPAAPAPAAATTPIPAKDPGANTQSKPGAIVQKATADTQNASDRAEQGAGTSVGIDDGKTDGTTSVGPASSGVNTNPVTKAPATGQTSAPAPISKDALASLPRDVRNAVEQRKVIALLFLNNRSYGAGADQQGRARVAAQGRAQGGRAAQGDRPPLLEQPLLRRPRRAQRAQARQPLRQAGVRRREPAQERRPLPGPHARRRRRAVP